MMRERPSKPSPRSSGTTRTLAPLATIWSQSSQKRCSQHTSRCGYGPVPMLTEARKNGPDETTGCYLVGVVAGDATRGAPVVCGSLLSVAANSVGTGFSYDSETLFASAISVATLLPFSVVGAIVAARHPRNAIGWIFCGVSFVVGLNILADGYTIYWLASGFGIKSLAETAAWFSGWAWIPLVYVPTSFLLLLFPDGRLPSSRWRPVAWCAGIGIVVF